MLFKVHYDLKFAASVLHVHMPTESLHSISVHTNIARELGTEKSGLKIFALFVAEYLGFFQKLAQSYQILSDSYTKVVDVMQSGKRLLGKYFRVAFFGQVSFLVFLDKTNNQ